ncbi:hypothetical protein COCON_G00097110 [Conger conger]|uniref:Uncharacterized protein n=1 Tax=Conger conger TaxID=82655 RepID=A0A9Q1DN38_CONCO|nr:hypothetical protein COCON_G00097110 [Conger conger]
MHFHSTIQQQRKNRSCWMMTSSITIQVLPAWQQRVRWGAFLHCLSWHQIPIDLIPVNRSLSYFSAVAHRS